MINIKIHEEVSTREDMAIILEKIADLIDRGYSSGYDPEWSLEGEEEPEDDEFEIDQEEE